MAVTVVHLATGYVLPAETTAEWWWQRPLWLLLPAVCALPSVLPPALRRREPAAVAAGAGPPGRHR